RRLSIIISAMLDREDDSIDFNASTTSFKSIKSTTTNVSTTSTYTVDDAIECVGFGRFQLIMSAIAGFAWALSTTCVFVGWMACSPLWGWFCDRYGRRTVGYGSLPFRASVQYVRHCDRSCAQFPHVCRLERLRRSVARRHYANSHNLHRVPADDKARRVHSHARGEPELEMRRLDEAGEFRIRSRQLAFKIR
ncbi:hypothetical protein PRIPAC_81242, partial [Pristionchus pacificus]|uniref:Uncharacterized protein n=1 Tax=Pristionchus pacificus TaxID=54126 RepID=A0A2A6BWU3_PRIPA